MAWVAVDKNEKEFIYTQCPVRVWYDVWLNTDENSMAIELPTGSIEKLIGRSLSWQDEPVEIK